MFITHVLANLRKELGADYVVEFCSSDVEKGRGVSMTTNWIEITRVDKKEIFVLEKSEFSDSQLWYPTDKEFKEKYNSATGGSNGGYDYEPKDGGKKVVVKAIR